MTEPTKTRLATAYHMPNQHRALFLVCATLASFVSVRVMAGRDTVHPTSLMVFGSYWGSGWAALHGFDPYAQTPFTAAFNFGGLHIPELNLNPPLVLPLFQLLACFNIASAARILGFASIISFLMTVIVLLCNAPVIQRRQIIWIFAAPAFIDTLALGQIYVGLMVLSAVAWLALASGRSTSSGLAIGILVAIKPIFLLWPLVLWLAGHRRPAVVASMTALGLTALSFAVYGSETFLHWAAALTADRHALIPTNASLGGFLTRLGLPRLGLAVGAIVGLGTMEWARRRRPNALDASAIALVASIVAAPLSWFHYTLVLVPFLLTRPWGPSLSAAALLLCVPVAVPLAALNYQGWESTALAAIYVTGVLIIFATCLQRSEPRVCDCEPAGTGRSPV